MPVAQPQGWERPDWYDKAACRPGPGQLPDPSPFFPGSGDNVGWVRALWCDHCPVQPECAEIGLGEDFGVWGGLSERDRRRTRRARRLSARQP